MSTRQVCGLSICTLMLIAGLAGAAEPPKADPAAMMKTWEKYATPGAPHQVLGKLAGKCGRRRTRCGWTSRNRRRLKPAPPSTR
jgi:hypothetical protein